MAAFSIEFKPLCIVGLHRWTQWEHQSWELDEKLGGGIVHRDFRECKRCYKYEIKEAVVLHQEKGRS